MGSSVIAKTHLRPKWDPFNTFLIQNLVKRSWWLLGYMAGLGTPENNAKHLRGLTFFWGVGRRQGWRQVIRKLWKVLEASYTVINGTGRGLFWSEKVCEGKTYSTVLRGREEGRYGH